MADMSNEISRFRWLLVYLSDQLVKEDVTAMKGLLKNHLGQDFNRQIDEPLMMFDVLEKKNLIHEGDINILTTTLTGLGRMDLVEQLEEYEREREVVVQKFNSKASLVEGPFFGREKLLDSIVGVLNERHTHVHVVCISGMPGAGKTRLAYEACYRLLQFHQLISVDLREITTIEAAFFAILHRLDVESRTFEPDILFSLIKSFSPTKAGGAIFLLDSADHLLDPGTRQAPNINYEPFIDMIRQLINQVNPLLKVVITSRSGLEKSSLNPNKVTCFTLEGDNELDVEDAVKMMQYHAGKTEINQETGEGLVRFCGKIPLAIRVIGSRFQDGNIKPKDLLKYLQNTKSKGRGIIHSLTHLNLSVSDQLSVCLENCIRALPHVHKNYLIKLAVIPGSFSIKAARDILEFEKGNKVALQLDLQTIMYRSLLESDRNEAQSSSKSEPDDVRYSMHLLLRSFIQQLAQENEAEGRIYRDAEKRFIGHYGGKLRKICKLMETDYVSALNKKDADYVNYQEVITLLQSSTRYDSPDIIKWLNMAVNHLLVPKQRRAFFQKRAEIMKCKKHMQSYADYKCHEVYQLLLLGEPAEPLLKLLDEAETYLEKVKNVKYEDVQLSLALCYHVRGDVLCAQGRLSEVARRCRAEDAKPWLEKALNIRREYLGDHLLTARTLLSLGSTMRTIGVIDPGSHFIYVHNDMIKALDFYQEALDMVNDIAGSLKHMETPNILLAMGACMHEIGRHEKAIELYRESLTLEESLGISGTEKTCTLLKNMAMGYYVMERYEDALKLATRAMEGRKTLMGVHQQTARSIYFVGLIHMNLKNYKQTKKYYDETLEMEETLWKQGKQHSEDWTRLKEKMEMLLEIEGKVRAIRKYRRRFLEAEKSTNQSERNPEEDKSEEEDGFSTSSSGGSSGRKRKSSTSASSLHSTEGKVLKEDERTLDECIDFPDGSSHTSSLAEMFSRPSIHDLPSSNPNIPEDEDGATAFTPSNVSVSLIRASDSEYDDHDSVEECYGINPRRGPREPKKTKKKSMKATTYRGTPSSDSSSGESDPRHNVTHKNLSSGESDPRHNVTHKSVSRSRAGTSSLSIKNKDNGCHPF